MVNIPPFCNFLIADGFMTKEKFEEISEGFVFRRPSEQDALINSVWQPVGMAGRNESCQATVKLRCNDLRHNLGHVLVHVVATKPEEWSGVQVWDLHSWFSNWEPIPQEDPS